MTIAGEGLVLTEVDRHVARRLRGKRLALGLAVADVASILGMASSDIDAYERAEARVPPEHLARLSELMDVPLAYFFPTPPRSGA